MSKHITTELIIYDKSSWEFCKRTQEYYQCHGQVLLCVDVGGTKIYAQSFCHDDPFSATEGTEIVFKRFWRFCRDHSNYSKQEILNSDFAKAVRKDIDRQLTAYLVDLGWEKIGNFFRLYFDGIKKNI